MGYTQPQQLFSYNLKVINKIYESSSIHGTKMERKKKEGKTKPVKKDQSASEK